MRILRAGFVVLPLLLAACSFPTKPFSSDSSTNQADTLGHVKVEPATDANTAQGNEVETAELSHQELLAKYQSLQTLAEQNIEELETRLGYSISKMSLSIPSTDDMGLLKSKVAQLQDYTSDLSSQILALDKRVVERRDQPNKGDLLQVHLSALEVDHQTSFKAQPLVGNWIRGESRVVRLNENFLMENGTSEPLNLTYTETYQIIINEKLIGTFGPNRSKYELEFDAPTADQAGQIVGTLKIRIPD
ncbi:hypothetical protein MAQ5080_01156 [Marinomonas aquimarina]|uniref:DUF3251 domain-containing protein n=1 Tax=Marinomonas aquimarina TaxID=295068 RepID=A0A1A8TAB1_9GAMM|nr:hypothetical protein [Marinomonas aquimarina]SBS28636.1 hypothetical protein MAQ5080_01156 [Marinomonas aquimarina]